MRASRNFRQAPRVGYHAAIRKSADKLRTTMTLRIRCVLFAAALSLSHAAALRAQPAGDVPSATPAERVKIARDFKVELIYNVPKNDQGSWVSMCVDPRGRLIVSDQYGGLFRITPGRKAAETKVEKLDVPIGHAQGLLYAFDSLYVMVADDSPPGRGLCRVRDTDSDDQFDKVELLRKLEKGGEHGPHAIVLAPDGKSLYCVIGNQTVMPELSGSKVPPIWSEDHLLPRMPDGRGFMAGVLGPGGGIYKVDPDGKNWELQTTGFRNEYDAAFHRNGDLFTYDADMEWDVNTPWYRPTRVCLSATGVDYGWRNGTGKWPVYYADTVPPVIDIGPGSPTGVTFGYGAKFPAKYQDALFICDWSYGKLYALHLEPDGAGYKATKEEFAAAAPLPLTDLIINPADGAMYFTVGGRKTQSGLYRVTYAGTESTAAVKTDQLLNELQVLRRKLEAFHGKQDPAALELAWPNLGHPDRFIRAAARAAVESQPAATWQAKALGEQAPQEAITGLIALVRVSRRDEFHRKPADPPVDPSLQKKVIGALERIDFGRLPTGEKLELLRAYGLTFTRLGPPDEATAARLVRVLEPFFPGESREVNSMLAELLIYSQSPTIAPKVVALMSSAPTQEEQLDLAKSIRMLKVGWTPELRRQYLEWFHRASGYRGGNSFANFVENIRREAVAAIPPAEAEALKDVINARPAASNPQAAFAAALKGRQTVKDWTVNDFAARLEKPLTGRDFDRGRTMAGAIGCFACHRFAGDGGAVGPDLTGVSGRFSPRDLLESIVLPNKEVSDQYQQVIFVMKKGDPVTGRIVNLGGDDYKVMVDMYNPNDMKSVKVNQIKEIRVSPLSPMPAGLINLLREDEVLDLLAYLLSGGDRENKMFSKG
jgi:putative heme-binding domain-containing protein